MSRLRTLVVETHAALSEATPEKTKNTHAILVRALAVVGGRMPADKAGWRLHVNDALFALDLNQNLPPSIDERYRLALINLLSKYKTNLAALDKAQQDVRNAQEAVNKLGVDNDRLSEKLWEVV